MTELTGLDIYFQRRRRVDSFPAFLHSFSPAMLSVLLSAVCVAALRSRMACVSWSGGSGRQSWPTSPAQIKPSRTKIKAKVSARDESKIMFTDSG